MAENREAVTQETTTQQSTPQPAVKKTSRFWIGTRIVAIILVIALVVQTVLSHRGTELTTSAAFQQTEQGKVTINEENLSKLASALKSSVNIQNQLEAVYQDLNTCLEKGDYEGATKDAEALYAYIGEDESAGPYLRSLLAQLYFVQEEYEACASTCEVILQAGEDSDAGFAFMKGVSELQCEKFEEASASLKQALNNGYADEDLCRLQLLLALYNTGNYEEAAKEGDLLLEHAAAAQTAAASNSEGAVLTDEASLQTAQYLTALSYLQLGSYEKSASHLEALTETAPEGEYFYYLGVSYLAQEKYEEGEAAFGKALEKKFDTTGCYYNYGLCAYAAEDLEAAVPALQTVVERNDDAEYVRSAQELLDTVEIR